MFLGRENLIMDWKEFLKPYWRNFLLIIVLLILSSELSVYTPSSPYVKKEYHGFPAIVYTKTIDKNTGNVSFSVEYTGLIMCLIFYYFISYLIVYVYDILKKESIEVLQTVRNIV